MGSYILALDVGTSAIHCLLTNSQGSLEGAAAAPMRYHTPEDCSELVREFDPGHVLATAGDLVGQLLLETGVKPGDIASIAITSQRQGLVLLDEPGNELCCSPNIDLRAIFEGATIDERWGEDVYRTTGHFPSLMFAPARVRWFQINRPRTFERISTVLTVAGWLMFRMTGFRAAEMCMEGEAGLLDISKGRRCMDLLNNLGFSGSLLAPIPEMGPPRGYLTGEMAEAWGLEKGAEVRLAGPDTQCGLLGMGLTEPGQVGALLGWSGAIQAITSQPCYHPERATWAGCYPLEGRWEAESNLGEVGTAYSWLKDLLLGAESPISRADELAAAAPMDDTGIIAHLGPGPESSFRAGLRRGGLMFPTPFSFQRPSVGSLIRSALENIAFSIKANLAALDEVAGHATDHIYIGGGMARSGTLAGILADVLGIPVKRCKIPQVSARGAAFRSILLDGAASVGDLMHLAAKDHNDVLPSSPRAVVQYESRYQEWVDVYSRLDWE